MLSGIVQSNTPTATTDGTTKTTASNQLGQDSFLNLLVAQLQNQDPTNAQDPTQMVQEMATFSSLEAQQNTNTLLASIQTQNSAIYQAQATSLIGKNIQVNSNQVTLSGGKATIGVSMPSAGDAMLIIKNAAGNTVSTIGPGSANAGDNSVAWNGKDSSGNQLPDGTYTVSAVAEDSKGNVIKANTTTNTVVTGVSYANNAVTVTAGGNQYSLTDINSISQ